VSPTDERLRALYRDASAFVFPALEDFGIVAAEALACGTPVVAFASGALAEIVEDGVTGFLVRDVGEMAAAMREAARLSPEACRDAAERRFSGGAMLGRYCELYARLAATGRRHAS
jgi:glycosyltransferase involved in cell wall biosynthesis